MGHRDCRRCSACRRPRVLRGVRVATSAPKPSGAGRTTDRNLPIAGRDADRHDSLRQRNAYTARAPYADGIPGAYDCGTAYRDADSYAVRAHDSASSDANVVRAPDVTIVPGFTPAPTPGVTPFAATPSGSAVFPTVAVPTPTATRPRPTPTPAPLDDRNSNRGQTWSDRWIEFTVEPHVCGRTLEFRGRTVAGASVRVGTYSPFTLYEEAALRPQFGAWGTPSVDSIASYLKPAPAGSSYQGLSRDQIVADILTATPAEFRLKGSYPAWLPDPEDAVLGVWGYDPQGGLAALRLIEVQECQR